MVFDCRWLYCPHSYLMKITQDVREYAAQKEIDEQAALGVGMKEKAEEFVAAVGEVYQII
jgi:phosphomethylpyrimidine synthase